VKTLSDYRSVATAISYHIHDETYTFIDVYVL